MLHAASACVVTCVNTIGVSNRRPIHVYLYHVLQTDRQTANASNSISIAAAQVAI